MEASSHNIAQINSDVLSNTQTSPQTVGQLEAALLNLFPRQDACEWDKTGIVVGDPFAKLTGVAIALDATIEAVRIASELGASVLLTHHPVFLGGVEEVHPYIQGRIGTDAVVYEAVSRGVALMNFHTCLDASEQALRVLPSMLKLEFDSVLQPLDAAPQKGFGSICSLQPEEAGLNLSQLAARCVAVFGRVPRVWGNDKLALNKVVTSTGSASDLLQACLDARCDCLVCGEVRYHAALDALAAGLSIIELGHDVSELPLCAVLASAAGSVGVPEDEIHLIDQSHNWWTPEASRR